MTHLTVVIPAYNEASALRAGKLHHVANWLKSQAFTTELILVDDGSPDETAQLAEGVADRVITIPHAGKAAAIVAGAIGVGSRESLERAYPVSQFSAVTGSRDTPRSP